MTFSSSSFSTVPFSANPTSGSALAYTIVSAQGSYSLTGKAAILNFGHKVTAVQGSYSLSGQAAGLIFGHKVTAVQGSYTLTGQAAILRTARTLLLAQGSYALTGQAAILNFGHKVTAVQGSYSLTGQASALRAARTLLLAQGSYSLSGQASNLLAARKLTAVQGSYTLTGKDVTLTKGTASTVKPVGDYDSTKPRKKRIIPLPDDIEQPVIKKPKKKVTVQQQAASDPLLEALLAPLPRLPEIPSINIQTPPGPSDYEWAMNYVRQLQEQARINALNNAIAYQDYQDQQLANHINMMSQQYTAEQLNKQRRRKQEEEQLLLTAALEYLV